MKRIKTEKHSKAQQEDAEVKERWQKSDTAKEDLSDISVRRKAEHEAKDRTEKKHKAEKVAKSQREDVAKGETETNAHEKLLKARRETAAKKAKAAIIQSHKVETHEHWH